MSHYIVTPILGIRNIPYYVVTDTSTGKAWKGMDATRGRSIGRTP